MKPLVTKQGLATHFCVSTRTIERWVKCGVLPAPVTTHGHPRWSLKQIEEKMVKTKTRQNATKQKKHLSSTRRLVIKDVWLTGLLCFERLDLTTTQNNSTGDQPGNHTTLLGAKNRRAGFCAHK